MIYEGGIGVDDQTLIGLYWARDEDAIRSNDIKSNAERKKMQATLSKADYIKSLQMKLTFNVNVKSYAPRIAELANKTNQFIFNYQRYDLTRVEKLMEMPNVAVVSVVLSDKLSDFYGKRFCRRNNRFRHRCHFAKFPHRSQ